VSQSIRVVIIDDHTLFRKGLAELLEHGGVKVAGITGKADEARQLVGEQKPDVVIMDLHMPPTDGLTLFQSLGYYGCQAPTLILTLSDSQEDMANALRVGVRGYLLKDMEPDDLVDAIQRAARGETVVAPAMTMKLVQLLQSGQQPGSKENMLGQLTQRELEILGHLARGESNKTIARALDISHDTVKLHVRHILAKLNLSSRVEAAIFAVENKVATPARSGTSY
jgi:two-component system nitrate/nitrite response regulator NarL